MANCRFLELCCNPSSPDIWTCRGARFGPSPVLPDVLGESNLKD